MNDRQLLDHYEITPKKSLGQNFLHDPNALEKIVDLAELPAGATVLEIGAGTGNLTRVLARRASRVVAVETDDRLLPLLEREFADQPHVRIVHADILNVNVRDLVGDVPYFVVANLPYYITSAILRQLLENRPKPQRLVITVQREVGDRLVAAPGDLSLLGVSVQYYGHPQIVMRLNPAAFWPRPDVESAVARIDVYDRPPVEVPDDETFFRVVRAGFGQKRKQLRNSLSAGLGLDKARVDAVLDSVNIDSSRRAETLSLEEWAAMAQVFSKSVT